MISLFRYTVKYSETEREYDPRLPSGVEYLPINENYNLLAYCIGNCHEIAIKMHPNVPLNDFYDCILEIWNGDDHVITINVKSMRGGVWQWKQIKKLDQDIKENLAKYERSLPYESELSIVT